eukprot:TRINITY_DN725_c0_g1_i2.p2 TRINITY_DN725_c0_g1~~TRINITY_DN725_c0_g1_i2.p2  ORF type:complete len:119 (+),score=49.28 TRINITY_DN725_c0_g1_i2:353-709(+)
MKELRSKPKEELEKLLEEWKSELFQLRVSKITGGAASKLSKIGVARKSIARILTVLNVKMRENLKNLYGGKKYVPLDLRPKFTRAIRRRLTKDEASRKTLRQLKKEKNFPQRKFAVKA